MAQLITPPICIPASINFGSTTVASTYSNAVSPWNGSSFTFNCTFTVLIQETSSYDTNPILQYNANNLTADMWFGLPNGNCYKIQSITSVNTQGTSCVLVLKDVDLYNLVVDNTGNGNNFPPEGFIGLFFTIGSDGLPVITPTEQIRSQIGDITNWLNDLHDRFRLRNYITDYFTININDTSYTGIVEGNFVKINSSGSFVKVTGTTENDLLSIAGIVSSADTPEQGNLRIRPLGRVVTNLNILVGSIGDVLYFDPNQVGSLTATKPATGVFPVYIKLSSTSAILKSGGGGASGTAGTAGTSGTNGTAGTSGATGTSGSSGTSGGSGTSGSSGTTGTSGTNGSSGTDGSSGTSGTNGTDGSSGTNGTSATSGSSGTNGTSATSGTNGTSASSGSSGTSGTNGTDGSSGTSATSGSSGSSGTSATSGTSGSSGTNGTSGTSASSGTAGTSGQTGTAGTSGINGVSGGQIYYLNQSLNTNSAFGSPTYKEWSPIGTTTGQQTVVVNLTSNTRTLIATYATNSGVPNATNLPSGNWAWVNHFSIATNTDVAVDVELYKYTIGGVSTLLGTTNVDTEAMSTGVIKEFFTDLFLGQTTLNSTDRLYCQIYAEFTAGGGNHDITFYTEGTSNYSYAQTTFNAPSGTSGTSGVDGTSGTSGTNGTSGTSASSGSSGTAGTNGTSASSGTSGTNGTDGSSGSSGTTGTSGTNGTSGSSGTSASSGSSGTTGTSGTNGTTGTSGTSGTDGSSGTTGTSGVTGVSGTSGTSGADGSSGATGSSGSSGTSGGSGTSGSSGTSGTAGTSGSSGFASSSARSVEVFTATAGQTTFTVTGGYNLGMVDVYVNGVKFVSGTDFTATNGTTVVMTTGLAAGNIVEIDNLLTAYLPTNALRTITTFTATAAQTTFSVSYTQGLIDVFYNGSNLAQSEYTATNGTTVVLATACQVNDIVAIYAYSYAVGAYSGIGGSGTINTIPKFTASSTIGDSAITDNGTTVTLVSRALSGTSASFSSTATATAFIPSGATIPTNGMYLSAANTLDFATNTTNRLSINSAGNIGIGGSTVTDSHLLNIQGSTASYNVGIILNKTNATAQIWGITNVGALTFYDYTNSSERMRITSTGNVGIGVIPSAWYTGYTAMQLGASASIYGNKTTADTNTTQLANNAYLNTGATNWQYINTDEATRYEQVNGEHNFYSVVSGSGNITWGTSKMTINSAGNVGIGTSSPARKLTVVGTIAAILSDANDVQCALSATATEVTLAATYGSTGSYLPLGFNVNSEERMRIKTDGSIRITGGGATTSATLEFASSATPSSGASIGVSYLGSGSYGPLTFATGGAERMRIQQLAGGGFIKASNNGSLYVSLASPYHEFNNSVNSNNTIFYSDAGTLNTDGVVRIDTTRNTTNNSYYVLTYYNGGSGTYRFRVADSGNVTNTNNSYGPISDIKLKENIVDASPKLDDLMKVRIVNYNLKADLGYDSSKQIGVIAQELEQVFAGLVDEHQDKDREGNDLGTTTKSVKMSVFVPMLIKAMQEQQAQIEELKKIVATK